MNTAYLRTLALVLPAALAAATCLMGEAAAQPPAAREDALRAFEIVRSVLQHPRCQNCHIPGDSPFLDDAETPHDQNVVRGPAGRGAVGNECSSCHQKTNLPVSYGEHVPPGSPGWRLPPPHMKMVFNGLSPRELCRSIKNPRSTGGKNLSSMLAHIRDNGQVAWGWAPGGKRAVPPASRAETITAFRGWMNAGAPCPL